MIVRPSGVYGPTDINDRVVQLFCEKALLGEKLVVNRCEATIDFTWIEDIADGLALAATYKNAANETFNVASGRGRSLGELVEILRGHFPNLEAEVRSEADPTIPNRGGLDVSKWRADRLHAADAAGSRRRGRICASSPSTSRTNRRASRIGRSPR